MTPGTSVLSAPDDDADLVWVWPFQVEQTIEITEKALLLLTIEHADGQTEVIRTTDDHPFFVLGRGWTEAELLSQGDRLRTLRGEAQVRSKAFTNTRVPVYNLSIPGSPTYFVGEWGVWVHNSDACGFLTSIKKWSGYKGFRNAKNGLTKNNVDDHVKPALRDIAEGKWHKVYRDGWQDGQKVSIHYFEHSSGKIAMLGAGAKIKPYWSNRSSR